MNIVSWVVVGLIAGLLAKLMLPGEGGQRGQWPPSRQGLGGNCAGGHEASLS